MTIAKQPPLHLRRGHGTPLRGLDAVARSPEGFGRFGRMFPELPPARYGVTLEDDGKVMTAVGQTMIKIGDPGKPITVPEPEDENTKIPAGYTYFGQFIDHDITLDVASSLDRATDPSAIEDFRTPRFDLDCVYGRGPDDQPYLYNADFTMRLGPDRATDDMVKAKQRRPDVLRVPPDAAADSTQLVGEPDCAHALLGDKRNDENSIVVQIHALFIRLHNAFMKLEAAAHAHPSVPMSQIFVAAQRRTRWTYQYLVIHDFLPRIVGKAMFEAVWNNGKPDLKYYTPDDARFPYMPVEFSVAAYRMGHTMVRPSYALNAIVGGGKDRLPVFGERAKTGADASECDQIANLNGFRPLPAFWGIDWSFFFGTVPAKVDAGKPFIPQPSYRLDTLLADPLMRLPDINSANAARRSLAVRNLQRSVALGLPSGQAVARRMGLVPLTDKALWDDAGNLRNEAANENVANRRKALLTDHPSLHGNAPLWYYILREAELTNVSKGGEDKGFGGTHLGPVGGRIVAEVLIGLLVKDEQSFFALHPRWLPADIDGKPTPNFTMETLAKFVDAPPREAREVA